MLTLPQPPSLLAIPLSPPFLSTQTFPRRIAGCILRGSPLPPPRIGLSASDSPATRRLQPWWRPAPPLSYCASLLPYYPLTLTSPAGSTDVKGYRSSSISSSWILLCCRSHPPPCTLCRSHLEVGGGGCGGSAFPPVIGLLGQVKQGRYCMQAAGR